MDISELQQGVTVYGRVAFGLCLADLALGVLVRDPSYPLGQQAVREMERWLAGAPVNGITFSDLLYDSNEEGIMRYEVEAQERVIIDAYICLEDVIGYVARHAYERSGDISDELANEFTEEALEAALDYARRLPTFDPVRVQRVYDDVLTHCRSEAGNEWGPPINRQDLMRRADA
jgi:hypothetical protein